MDMEERIINLQKEMTRVIGNLVEESSRQAQEIKNLNAEISDLKRRVMRFEQKFEHAAA